MSIKVDKELCLLCGGCSAVCPKKIILMEKTELKFKEGCIMCMICVDFCPSGALSDEKL